ncbi:ankyrin repeat domain-containing protein [Planctomycetota bacterium]
MKPLNLLCLVLMLMIIAGGCERELTKPTEDVELTETGKRSSSSLHQAAVDGDIEQVRLLISKGANVNAQDEKGNTPLCRAVESGKMEIVQLLVEAGADVNAGSWPPLCMAVDENNTAIAEYLIAHGADVNAGDDWTALQEAPYISNNVEMVELLIANGADINAGPYTALHAAVDKDRLDIVELLIAKGANVNPKDKSGSTPLHYAGKIEVVQLLVEAKADINTKDEEGNTPLHDASRTGKIELVQFLVEAGADVNAKDNDGRAPLHLAAESADKDVVELLLTKGARIDEKDDEYGFTALHYAARFGSKNVAEFLIAKGANIDAKDKEDRTPLYIAVQHDHKVAELLINNGADGNIITESGQTLFQLAQERKSIESTVPDMIFDGEPNSAFGIRIACGDVDGDGYDDIVVGGMTYDNERGRAYLFYGGPDIDTTCDLILDGEKEGDWFGSTVSCGDIDNDGYDDIVIGAPRYKNQRGRAYLYWGSKRNSMDANPDKIFDGEAEEGASFSRGQGPVIYDIDNDGYRDIIFSSYRGRGKRIGRAYLYYGNKKELMDASYDLIFTGENNGDHFGFMIGCGDVDNDGYGDIIIGARLYPGGGLKGDCIGRAYLYYGGSRSNMDAKADKIFNAESKDKHYFGQDIVCIDQNKDGHDDIIIGGQGYNDRQGRVYLFYGDTRPNLDTAPDKTFDGEIKYSDYGFFIVCGDIDGDDISDIVIGADFIRQKTGRVYLYWGSELSGPSTKPGRIFTGENPGDWFSQMMACGDVNNDGFEDLVIGARGYKAGSEQGRAYLYYGGPKDK